MTDTDNPTGIYTKEVSIYDEDGVIVHPTTEEKQDNANLTTTSQLRHKVLLGGEGPKAFGAVLEQRTEMIFSNSVQVALVVVAKTNDSSEHTINLSWYEKMRQ